MDGLFPLIFHGERSELREKYGIEWVGSIVLQKDVVIGPCTESGSEPSV
jgi:hypothetical protein